MSLREEIRKQMPLGMGHVANDIADIFITAMDNHATIISQSFGLSPAFPTPAIFANSVYAQLPGASALGLAFLMAIETSVAQITTYLMVGATSLNSSLNIGVVPEEPVQYSAIEACMINSAAMPANLESAENYTKIAKAISRGIMLWAVSLVPSEDLRLNGQPIEVAV